MSRELLFTRSQNTIPDVRFLYSPLKNRGVKLAWSCNLVGWCRTSSQARSGPWTPTLGPHMLDPVPAPGPTLHMAPVPPGLGSMLHTAPAPHTASIMAGLGNMPHVACWGTDVVQVLDWLEQMPHGSAMRPRVRITGLRSQATSLSPWL